ncbi:MAG: tetratricopeptide repeat protein [Bryobacterales bacterium]
MKRAVSRIAVLLVMAAALPAATFDELAARAKTAREAGRYDEAIGAYRQALAEKPEWAEGRWFYAVSLYEAKQFEDAAGAFESVTEVSPQTGAAWILLGLCQFQLERYKPALEHLTRGRALKANDDLLSTASYYLALLMNHYGEFEAATQLLLPFALKENASPTVIEALGLAMLRRTYLPPEIPAAERAKINAVGQAAFLSVAKTAGHGMAEMERLVEQYPDDLDIRFAYGSMLVRDEPDRAIEQFRKVLAGNPDDYLANRMLGTLLSKKRKFDEALQLLGKALELRPHSIAAQYQLAVATLATGRIEESRGLLEQIVQQTPEFTAARVTLATAYYRLGRKEDGDRERAAVRELNAKSQTEQSGIFGAPADAENDAPEAKP